MPTKRTVAQLVSLINNIIKTNNNEEITAAKDNGLRQEIIVSFLNLLDGGLLVEKEAGYSSAIPIVNNNAFITKKYFEDNIPEGSGDVKQLEFTSPELIPVSGICTWTSPNTLYDKFAEVVLYRQSTNEQIGMYPIVTDTNIIYKFVSETTITANSFRATVQGMQKDSPTPPTSDYVEGDYVEGDYVL